MCEVGNLPTLFVINNCLPIWVNYLDEHFYKQIAKTFAIIITSLSSSKYTGFRKKHHIYYISWATTRFTFSEVTIPISLHSRKVAYRNNRLQVTINRYLGTFTKRFTTCNNWPFHTWVAAINYNYLLSWNNNFGTFKWCLESVPSRIWYSN